MIARPRPVPQPAGRRLALTPIGFDVIVALAHDPDGFRLTPLVDVFGSPASSIQASFRVLMANGLVTRTAGASPVYRLADHPAREALTDLAVVLQEPTHTLEIVLRASPAVSVSAFDQGGFVAGLDPAAAPAVVDRLRATLTAIADAWPTAPAVQLSDAAGLERLAIRSDPLRSRRAATQRVKRSATAVGHPGPPVARSLSSATG